MMMTKHRKIGGAREFLQMFISVMTSFDFRLCPEAFHVFKAECICHESFIASFPKQTSQGFHTETIRQKTLQILSSVSRVFSLRPAGVRQGCCHCLSMPMIQYCCSVNLGLPVYAAVLVNSLKLVPLEV